MLFVLLLIIILPLKRHPIWTESGGDFTGTKYLGALCLLYALAYLVARKRFPRYLETSPARWYAVFFFLVFISAMSASATPLSTVYNPILGPSSLLLLGFILLSVIDSLKRLKLVLLASVASVGIASLYVIREWVKIHGWQTGSRGEWVVGDSNHFAVSIIAVIPLALYLGRVVRPGWERWLCRVCVPLSLVAVIIGASRGGLFGLVTAMLFCAARSGRRVRNTVAVLVLLATFNIAYPRSPLRRLLNPDIHDTGSEEAHRASWEAGLKMLEAHPVTGVGVGVFRLQMLRYAPGWYVGPPFMAHSAYVSTAAEMGVPGFVLFLGVLTSTLVTLEKVHRMKFAPLLITQVAVGLQAALLGSSISIAFISAEHHEYLWLTIFESMCLVHLSRQLSRRRVRVSQVAEKVPEAAPVIGLDIASSLS